MHVCSFSAEYMTFVLTMPLTGRRFINRQNTTSHRTVPCALHRYSRHTTTHTHHTPAHSHSPTPAHPHSPTPAHPLSLAHALMTENRPHHKNPSTPPIAHSQYYPAAMYCTPPVLRLWRDIVWTTVSSCARCVEHLIRERC